jgi:hypothetical protein
MNRQTSELKPSRDTQLLHAMRRSFTAGSKHELFARLLLEYDKLQSGEKKLTDADLATIFLADSAALAEAVDDFRLLVMPFKRFAREFSGFTSQSAQELHVLFQEFQGAQKEGAVEFKKLVKELVDSFPFAFLFQNKNV